jgi:hypothetical protein
MIFRRGSTGNVVAVIQYGINRVLGTQETPLRCDGIFGPKTETRVRDYQRANGLVPDGVIGPKSLDSLFAIVTMTGSAKFTRKEQPSNFHVTSHQERLHPLQLSIPGGSFIPPFQKKPQVTISPGSLLSPGMAEFVRQQEAFWKWFNQPAPKSDVPQPNPVLVPMPGPFGPVILPVPSKQITLPGPPLKITKGMVEYDEKGGDFTLSVKSDATVVAGKGFKEATYGIGLDWVVFRDPKKRFEIEVSPSLDSNNEGEFSVSAEVTLKSGEGLTLKQKFGQGHEAKLGGYLSTAITSDLAIQAAGGLKGVVAINVTKVGPMAIKVEAGIKGFTKIAYGPVKLANGGEEHQVTVTPFGGTGWFSVIGEF